MIGARRQADWDDHGEAYAPAHDGPDLWITVTVPEGLHQIGLYFVNYNAHDNKNALRDYVVAIYPYSALAGENPVQSAGLSPLTKNRPLEDIPQAMSGQPLARARVLQFSGGVYKQFTVSGPGQFLVRIQRNYSFNTICSGVFVDTFTGPLMDRARRAFNCMGGVRLEPKRFLQSAFSPSGAVAAAIDLRGKLDAIDGHAPTAREFREAHLTAYRTASREQNAASLLENWRSSLPLWSDSDRIRLAALEERGWKEFIRVNPQAEIAWRKQ
jgi:hypothetical protein